MMDTSALSISQAAGAVDEKRVGRVSKIWNRSGTRSWLDFIRAGLITLHECPRRPQRSNSTESSDWPCHLATTFSHSLCSGALVNIYSLILWCVWLGLTKERPEARQQSMVTSRSWPVPFSARVHWMCCIPRLRLCFHDSLLCMTISSTHHFKTRTQTNPPR